MEHRMIHLSELEATLTKLGAKLRAHEVHALYLGALTSTRLGLGPQQLLATILGDDVVMGESLADANAVIGVLFGYWNSLVSEREAGPVRLARCEISGHVCRDLLLTFAERRREELRWYIRGIDAGGDDPAEWGDSGHALLERLAEASMFFDAFAETLERIDAATAAELTKSRELLLKTSTICEELIRDLMDVTEQVRREALVTSSVMQGRRTHDGVRIGGGAPRVGRNEPCPCGSGKKWKRCCGGEGPVH